LNDRKPRLVGLELQGNPPVVEEPMRMCHLRSLEGVHRVGEPGGSERDRALGVLDVQALEHRGE
jgi:hypothetical protein